MEEESAKMENAEGGWACTLKMNEVRSLTVEGRDTGRILNGVEDDT